MRLALLGLPKSWNNYQDLVKGREQLQNWEFLWSNLVQEKIRRNTRDETSSKGEDEEKCVLDGKTKKGKGNKYQSKAESSQGGKNKYLSKIKCVQFHELKHYATKCPHKKVGNEPLGGATCEDLASQFELEFTLMACMEKKVMASVWYLDSGASFHMTGNK